jgi:hypothetical protein
MNELLIQIAAGTNHALAFATAWAQVTFSSMLKNLEAVEHEGVWQLPEAVLQSLKDIGWLRVPSNRTEAVSTIPIPHSLLPMGYTPSAIIFEKNGELRKCSMPTIMQGILGYLAFESNKPEDLEKALGKIKKLSPTDAGKEFRYGKWERHNLVGAIEQAYRWALDQDAELVKELIETGKDILQYETSSEYEDALLGVVKQGKKNLGKNLVGHVLMALRGAEEYGGEPDPRLELIRGYREYTIEEVSPGGEGFTQENLQVLAEWQANIIIGDGPGKDAEETLKHAGLVEALKGFILENNWWPLPFFQDVVLVENTSDFATVVCPEPLLQWLLKLSQAGAMEYIGAETNGDDLVLPVDKIDLGVSVKCIPYDAHADALKVHLYLAKSAEWWTWYLSEQTGKLDASQMVKLFTILAKNRDSCVEWTCDSQEIHFLSGNEHYTWNFEFRSVEARQTRKAFKHIIMNEKPTSSNFIMLWLALRALSGFKGLNGTLSSLTNLWEREANYGVKWEEDHPTRRVRDNSWAPLNVRMDYVESFGLEVLNGKFDTELFLKLISTPSCRHDAYVDKNGSKVLAGNGAGAASLTSISYPEIALQAFDALDAGVNPLLVLALVLPKDELFNATVEILSGTKASLIVMRKYGNFWTLNDGAKMPKFLNRAQQGASWNEALVEIEFKGEVIKRSPSMMVIQPNYQKEWVKATAQDEADFLANLLG